jgi:putative membrane protein
MKNHLILALFSMICCSTLTVNAQEKDPVKSANAKNEEKADKALVNDDVAEFLVKTADARMMGSKEGQLAVEKGTQSSIKEYGNLMIRDQAVLMAEVKKLAIKKNISLPAGISDKKEDGREDLSEKSGQDFDEKFIKMMIIDHERDIKLFKKAIEYPDQVVAAFAKKYLPMIEEHLTRIKSIKAARK